MKIYAAYFVNIISVNIIMINIIIFWPFYLFRPVPMAYGGSQARGLIRVVAAWPT